MAKKRLSEKEKRQAARRIKKSYLELGWPISHLSLFEILQNRPKTRLLRGEFLKKLMKK